jgi:putative ABC transport system permease protein
LKQDRRIENAAIAGQVIGTGVGMEQMFAEGPSGMEQRGCLALMIGDDYLEMMGIELVSGRLFQNGEDIETEGFYLANESAVKLMGWGDDAVGKKVSFWDGMNPGKIIGVVKDFNVNSLHRGVDPMFIIKGHYGSGNYHIRLTGEDVPGVVEMLKEKFGKLDPEHPFEYFFLDQKYDEQYREDLIQNKLLSLLSYVCVFISLLGLLGLSAFAAIQRTKEIGVRKVLGASIPGILVMLSKDVVLLVLIAIAIAAPMAWWVIDGWLSAFAYRAPVNILLLAMILIGSLLFVVTITVFQSLKTATTNPVDSLKYE